MLAASGLAIALRATHKMADARPSQTLDMIVPSAFGDWREEKQSSAQIVDPQQQEQVDKIYSQTLTRTYVNSKGYRVMLSIAYGADQRDSMQVHRPEVCYPAQGFILFSQEAGRLALTGGSIPVTRILTAQGLRNEPVTYWITIGDQVILSNMQKKRAEIRHAFHGQIADGMLVRVSSIDTETDRAYGVQEQFAAQMVDAIAPDSQPRFVGNDEQN